jgi:hypothetical protein
MSVYFVYRSFDRGPTGKYLKQFDDDTVLAWFQRNWDHVAIADRDESDRRLEEAVGCEGWFLWNPFHAAAEDGVPIPQNFQELLTRLRGCVSDDAVRGSAHCVQVFTEEDGEGGALYYFDDHFLKRSGGRAAYLLHEDWRFPTDAGEGLFNTRVETTLLEPPGTGAGATYAVLLERESKYPLDDLGTAYRIEGVRLPDLAQHLCRPALDDDGGWEWPSRLRQLPALMLAGVELPDPADASFLKAVQSEPGEGSHWAAWADWRQDHDLEPPGVALLRGAFERIARFPGDLQDRLPRDANIFASCRSLLAIEAGHLNRLRVAPQSLIRVANHMAQICLDDSWANEPHFGQWVFFDDLWASAHPDLASALLRYAAKWDVLSPD